MKKKEKLKQTPDINYWNKETLDTQRKAGKTWEASRTHK
jgi:hypothetical protein